MPKKTAADRARNSIEHHKGEIQKAYESGQIDAPLEAAKDWLLAALKQQAELDPESAAEHYKHATEQVIAYAKHLQNRVID